MPEEINVPFKASLAGGTQATFAAMQKGFKMLAKELQSTANELLKLQNTKAANAVGHVSMAVNKFASGLTQLGKSTKKAQKDIDDLSKTEKMFAKTSDLARQAWEVFKKDVEAGSSSFKVAAARAMQYDKALNNLMVDIKAAGGSERDLRKEINFTKIEEMKRNGQLKLTGQQFKLLTKEAYNYFVANDNIIRKMREAKQETSLYTKTLKEVSKVPFNQNFAKGVQELGKSVGYSDERFKLFIPVIKRTQANLERLRINIKANTGETATWINQIDSASLILRTMENAQNGTLRAVKQTANGFKILSLEGLKPFNGLTLEAANKLGMLDTSFRRFTDVMRLVQKATGGTAEETKRLMAEFLKSTSSFAEAEKKARDYIKGIEATKKAGDQLKLLRLRYKELINSTTSYGANARKLYEELARHPDRLQAIKIKIQQLNKDYNDNARSVKKARDAMAVMREQFRDLINSQDRFGSSARKLVESLRKQGVEIGLVRAKLKNLERDQHKMNNSMSTMVGIVNRLAKSLRTYASYMISSTILRGITSGFRAATDAIIDHDQGLQDLKAIMQATVNEVSRMDKVILQVAKDTKFSVGETAEAMKKLGQAGFTANEAIAGMPNVANLATGTLESLSSAVDLTSTAVRVFQLGMGETGKVADIFANAVTKSRLTVGRLNTSFNYIGPLAKAAGLSLKETSGAMMLLANAGLRASTIGTGFRRVLALLLKPSDDFRRAVAEAGFAMDDFNPLVTDFSKIIENLPKVVRNSQEAIEMFGLRGSSVITAFTNQGASEFNRLSGYLDRTGTAATMAATQMEGLGVMLKNVKDRFGVFAVTVGKSGLTEVLKGVIASVRSLLDVLIQVAEGPIGRMIFQITALVAAFGAASVAITAVTTLLKTKFIAEVVKATKAMWGLAATPIGIALIATASAIMLAVNAWQEHNKVLREAIDAEAEYSGKLEKIKSDLDAYNKTIIEKGKYSKEAKDAALGLKESIEAVGRDTEETANFVDKFSGSIDRNSGAIQNSNETVDALSAVLDEKLVGSYEKAAAAADHYYKRHERLQRVMQGSLFGKFSDGIKIWGQWLRKTDKEVDNIIDSTGRFGKALEKLLVSVSYVIPGGQQLRDYFIDPVKEATDAFSELQVKAKIDPKAAATLDTFKSSAEKLAESLLDGKDKAEIYSGDIKEIAHSYAVAQNRGAAFEGALIDAMINLVQKAKDYQAANERMAESVGDAVYVVQERYRELNNSVDTTYRDRRRLIESSVNDIELAATNELNIRKRQQQDEIATFRGTNEQRLSMAQRHEEERLSILEQAKTAVENLRMQEELIYLEHNKKQLANLETYYEAGQLIAEHHYGTVNELVGQRYAEELAQLNKSVNDKDALMIKENELLFQHQEDSLERSDAHFQKVGELYKEEYETRIEYMKLLPEEEEDLEETIYDLRKEGLQKQLDVLEQRKSAYASAIDTMRNLEKSLTDKIKAETQARKEFNKGVEETVLDLKRKTMTEEEVMRSKRREADKIAAEARSAMLTGDYNLAKKLSEAAIQSYNDVANSIDKQGKSTAEYKREISAVIGKIEDVKGTWNFASDEVESSLEKQQKKASEFANQLSADMLKLSNKV